MYKLTMEFKTKAELLAHLGGAATTAQVTTSIPAKVEAATVTHTVETGPTPAQKAAATKKANKAKKDAAVKAAAQTIVAEAVAAPVFDRASCLATVKAKAKELGDSGAAEESVSGLFMDIFKELSIPPMKVDLLQDEQLSPFSEKFLARADGLVPVQAQPSNFI